MRRSICDDFASFQSEFPLQKVHLPRSNLDWCYYQAGPPLTGASTEEAVVLLHGTSGSAASFFYQVDALGRRGYRVLSVQYPAYFSVEEWCKGFDDFLDALECRNVHLSGAGLGAFLAQHFTAKHPRRVKSLLLCNGFAQTHVFSAQVGYLSTLVNVTPAPLLRKIMLDSFPQWGMDLPMKQAVDWMAQQVNDLSGDDLASRIALTCTPSSVGELRIEAGHVTLLEASGDTMVLEDVRRDLRQRYSSSRFAQLKARGDFPYLSSPEEVTLFLEVHLRGVGCFGREPEDNSSPALSAAAARLNSAGAESAEEDADSRAAMPRAEWTDEPSLSSKTRIPLQPDRWRNPFEDDPLL
eukprot:TRINITY_DN23380_c0_g1_i1.p1 TRINITY_DN23380_c0_g1~~TRINITY_DN23380_c0_g1_i1.p1  ORF type:complete len:396 (+),score=78.17 TRINITY_DN23380_c0_g1_i1:131-1189(+)